MTEREWRASLDEIEKRLSARLDRVRALRRGDATVKSFTRRGHWVKKHWVEEHEVHLIRRKSRG